MTLEQDPIQQLQKAVDHRQFDIQRLKALKYYKLWSHVLFFVWFFYFLALYLGILILFMFTPSQRKNAYAWLIRHYFKWYFVYRGMDHYATTPLPTSFSKPTLIFTLRTHDMGSLYMTQLFKCPVIVPLRPKMAAFRASFFIPWAFLGRLFRLISYPDQNYPANAAAIKSLLKDGYPVVVPLNFNYANPRYESQLLMIQDLQDLVTPSIDCYLLKLTGFESYPLASFVSPVDVSVKYVPLEKILDGAPMDSALAKVKIAQFFEFSSVKMI